MKRTIISLFLMICSVLAYSQQEAQFTHNMFTNMAVNPAYAGINKQICATTLFRQQWVGFTDPDDNKGAPQTILLTLDAPIRALRGGIGGSIFQDKLGFEKNIGVKLAYSYHQPIGPGILGIGLMGGLLNKSIDFSKFKPTDENDPLLMGTTEESTMAFDIAFGVFYNLPGKAFAGLSSSQIIQSKLNIPGLDSSKLKRHYYLTGGYHWVLPNAPDWELSPYLMIKSDFASTQYDIAVLCKWRNMVWGGLTYRYQDAVAILLGGYPFNSPGMNPSLANLRIGYAYDITTSALGKSGRSSGTHEIMLGYCFKIEIPTYVTKYKNVRFL
jgi:type IX secretion system PorP/SprF family membrane protein